MNSISVIFWFWFIATLSDYPILAFIDTEQPKCVTLRMDKMLKIKCFRMDLREIPPNLSTGVEVLDVSYNRIRKLNKTSFQRYRRVRYLVLYENMILSVEPGTFSHLSSLEEIDLSTNSLITIPLEIFNLPSLRNLYVDSNDLKNFLVDVEMLEKPIKAPLEYLNIANCELEKIPYLGILPYFWHLNASNNPLKQVTVESFLPMCQLRSVDLKSTKIPTCTCRTIVKYLSLRDVNISNKLICDNSEQDSCLETSNVTMFMNEYEECKIISQSRIIYTTWIYVGSGIAVFVLLFLLLLCICARRNARRARKRSERRKNKPKPEENGNIELLKDETLP